MPLDNEITEDSDSCFSNLGTKALNDRKKQFDDVTNLIKKFEHTTYTPKPLEYFKMEPLKELEEMRTQYEMDIKKQSENDYFKGK